MTSAKQKHPTIRISAETHKKVKELAEQEQTSMADVVAEAVKKYERAKFWERANAIWKKKMEDPEERAFWEKEDAILEGTLMDGLEEDEHWE